MRPVALRTTLPLALALLVSCGKKADDPAPKPKEAKATANAEPAPEPEPEPAGPTAREPLPEEKHFAGLTQITYGGENAEAYLSHDESRLVYQATHEGMECDQIFTMNLDGTGQTRVSNGKGRTTCAYYLPGDERILYASTHAAADDCLPPPDRSHGYVWKLYDEFDIYTATADGSDIQPLVAGPGYDAEATVSPKGDRIVFTSTRDGDPEIYGMKTDGSDVVRLTETKGYDGGPFFSPDGTKIIYRANHPEGEEELAKYEEMISKGLVRPTRLELFVMDADGGNQTQITENGKANFAPFFHPDGKRVIFASNMDDPKGRNFDLYLIGIDGEGLERVTYNDTFDGFPMFTRDGQKLVFASNRHNAESGDTNIFVADWKD
jgi:Tol biopolymer transport system component